MFNNILSHLTKDDMEKMLDDMYKEYIKDKDLEENDSSQLYFTWCPPPIPKCTCGADYTSNPKYHYEWCDLYQQGNNNE